LFWFSSVASDKYLDTDSFSFSKFSPFPRIWDSHSSGYEEFCILGYNAV
jgi:hypothetical protein